ncbi:hypothetical protein BGZ52_011374 [Haplosporangium bisporale]|nr:hypothetical protein BGZ52_011374 [Haplosporangium bisporale]
MLARTYSTLAAPLTGIFAVSKPSGITSTTILDHLQHVCRLNKTHPLVQGVLSLDGSKRAKRGLVKIGHGGTLDPLARGIVGIPLPREIPTRKVSIFALDLCSYANETPDPTLKQLGFKVDGHDNTSGSTYEFKSGFVPKSVGDPDLDPKHVPVPTQGGLLFHIRVHCSSGTYIRTLISDIATRLGTVGHMTDLLRVEQSGYKLGGEATLEMSDCEDLHKVNSAIQAGNRIWDKRYEKATFSASE